MHAPQKESITCSRHIVGQVQPIQAARIDKTACNRLRCTYVLTYLPLRRLESSSTPVEGQQSTNINMSTLAGRRPN